MTQFPNLPRAFSQRRRQYKLLRELMRAMHVERHQVLLLLVLSLVVAGFEGIGIGLLVPLAQGITDGSFSEIKLPQPLMYVVDSILVYLQLNRSSAVTFFTLASMIGLANFFGIFFTFVYAFYGQYLQGKYQWHLHTFVYSRYFSFGKLFFDKTSQGAIRKVLEYTTRIVELVRITQNNLTSFTQLLVYLLIMAWLSWELVLVVILVFPLLYWLSRRIMRRVGRLWHRAKDIAMDAGRESFNMLSALPLVWSFSREKESKEKYAKMNEQFRQVQLKAQTLGYITVLIPRLVTLVALYIIVIFITATIHRGQPLDLARVIIFLYVVSRAVPLVKVFNTVWVVVSEMTPPILEVLHLLGDKGKYIVKEGKKVFTGLHQSIRFTHLTFSYEGRKPILRDVSFNIPRGQITALVGPSGSGKSTIINLLMRFYEPPSKTIFLDDIDIQEFTFKSLRQHIAVVDQDPILLHDTLRNNFLFGQEEASNERLENIIDRIQLRGFINRLPQGINTLVGDRGVQLSGGEKQRVAIGRALLRGADVILLDEATSALDANTERTIQKTFSEMMRGKTALIIAHRLATIQSADQIIYLERGRVQEQGTLSQLLRLQGSFTKQWKNQMING